MNKDITQLVSMYLCVKDAAEIRKIAKVFSSYGWEGWIRSSVATAGWHSWGWLRLSHAAKSYDLNKALMESPFCEYRYVQYALIAKTPLFEPLLEPWIKRSELWLLEWSHLAATHRLENAFRWCVERCSSYRFEKRLFIEMTITHALEEEDVEASDFALGFLSDVERLPTGRTPFMLTWLLRGASPRARCCALAWMRTINYDFNIHPADLDALDRSNTVFLARIAALSEE
jgi:hypothetical protein